ncbi:MAG: DegV family protein [Bacillota bacterium]
MARVKIVTDSTADIPPEVARELDIAVVPLYVHFGEDVYKDGVDLTPQEFFEMLTKSRHNPTTSQPSPGDFLEVYKAAKDYDGVLSIHISSKLSGTYNSAVSARDMLPEMDIRVVDSKGASMVFGLIAIEAAKAAKRGESLDEICALVEKTIAKAKVFFAVDTLDYLHRNGRIGKAQHLLGSLLNFKPILTLEDGYVTSFDKVRGKNKVIPRLVELLRERIGAGGKIKTAVVHSVAAEAAAELAGEVKKNFQVEEMYITSLGAVIGTHTGPGTLAVTAYPVDH